MSNASSVSEARYMASTGESFSRANGSSGDTSSTSPMSTFVCSGTEMPAICAMVSALWPTIFAFRTPFTSSVRLSASSASPSTKQQPRRRNSAFTRSYTAVCTITDCSDAQIMPLSNVLE